MSQQIARQFQRLTFHWKWRFISIIKFFWQLSTIRFCSLFSGENFNNCKKTIFFFRRQLFFFLSLSLYEKNFFWSTALNRKKAFHYFIVEQRIRHFLGGNMSMAENDKINTHTNKTRQSTFTWVRAKEFDSI